MDSEHISKIRPSSLQPPSQITTNPHNLKSASSSSAAAVANGKAYFQTRRQLFHNNQYNEPLTDSNYQQKLNQSKPPAINRKNMEFLIPQVPNPTSTRQTNLGGPGLKLNNIKNHFNDNFHIIQTKPTATSNAAQPKMTKKQLKLAQAQLDKLTQINIHLQGMYTGLSFVLFYFFFRFFHLYILWKWWNFLIASNIQALFKEILPLRFDSHTEITRKLN